MVMTRHTLMPRLPRRPRVVLVPCLMEPRLTALASATTTATARTVGPPPADHPDLLVAAAAAVVVAAAAVVAMTVPHAVRAEGEGLKIPMAGTTPTDLRIHLLPLNALDDSNATRSRTSPSTLFPRSVGSRNGRTSFT